MAKNHFVHSIDRIEFHHGGRYDIGFWTTGKIKAYTDNNIVTITLNEDEAEDLSVEILKWIKKRKHIPVETGT